MASPPRPLRGSPPRRAALHRLSDSHANEQATPTLRMVGHPEASVYDTNPYPTKPSQVLPPGGQLPPQGSPFRNTMQEAVPTTGQQNFPREPSNEKHSQTRGYDSRQGSDAGPNNGQSSDVSFYTASPPESSTPKLDPNTSFLADNTPKLDTGTSFYAPERDSDEKSRPSNEVVQLPSVPYHAQSAGLAIYPSTAPAIPSEPSGHQPVSKDSDTSLSSTNSTGTMIVKKTRDGKKRVSYSAFPNTRQRSNSSRSSLGSPTAQRAVLQDQESTARRSPVSPSSPVSATFAPHERRTSSDPPTPGAESRGAATVQYPIIKPASASGSWAESSGTIAHRPPKAAERYQDRWNPHLSTVQSEGTGSNSDGARNSQGTWRGDSSRASKSSSSVLSPRMSSDQPPVPRRSSDLPAPLRTKPGLPPLPSPPLNLPNFPPPARQRDVTGSTIRVVHEEGSDVPDLPRTRPAPRGSSYYGDTPQGSARNSQFNNRPGSRASFFKDGIPAWAKAYYARPTSQLDFPGSPRDSRRLSTSTDNISLNIFRTRNRPQDDKARADYERRKSQLGIFPRRPNAPRQLYLADIQGPPRRKISPTWSPHLWHDRTSLGRRRSVFKAPSLDEAAEGNSFTKRNIQIIFFAFGFIFPLGAPLPVPSPSLPNQKY